MATIFTKGRTARWQAGFTFFLRKMSDVIVHRSILSFNAAECPSNLVLARLTRSSKLLVYKR